MGPKHDKLQDARCGSCVIGHEHCILLVLVRASGTKDDCGVLAGRRKLPPAQNARCKVDHIMADKKHRECLDCTSFHENTWSTCFSARRVKCPFLRGFLFLSWFVFSRGFMLHRGENSKPRMIKYCRGVPNPGFMKRRHACRQQAETLCRGG